MANISLYEPLNTRLNRLFSHLGLNSPSLFDDQNELPGLSLKLDVAEDDENYLVRADLPGVKKNDIRISVDGNQVSISAEYKNKWEDKTGRNLIHAERYCEGRVHRSFTVDGNIDESRVVAKYNDGVLDLTLPKKSGSNNRKQITVQ